MPPRSWSEIGFVFVIVLLRNPRGLDRNVHREQFFELIKDKKEIHDKYLEYGKFKLELEYLNILKEYNEAQ